MQNQNMSKKAISKKCILELYGLTGILEKDIPSVTKRIEEYNKERSDREEELKNYREELENGATIDPDILNAGEEFVFTLSNLVDHVIELADSKYDIETTRTTINSALNEILEEGLLKKGSFEEVSQDYDFSWEPEPGGKDIFIYLKKIKITNLFSSNNFMNVITHFKSIQDEINILSTDIKTGVIKNIDIDEIKLISYFNKAVADCLTNYSETELLTLTKKYRKKE